MLSLFFLRQITGLFFLFMISHQALTFALLRQSKLIFLPFKRVRTLAEFNFDRRAHDVQCFAEIVHQVTLVRTG